MNATSVAERVVVGSERDAQVASQVGLHLLGLIADRTGLSGQYSRAMPEGMRRPGHDRGRLMAQMAVMLAGGGECVSDVGALRDQPELFGDVAADATYWRVISSIDEATLEALRQARATAREEIWARRGAPEEIVLDPDATLVEIHSENKEQASPHYKRGFGFHPMLCFLDATGEALSGILRPGNAAANSGADQLRWWTWPSPSSPRSGAAATSQATTPPRSHPILVRTDTAGAVHEFVGGLVERNRRFSVGARVSDDLDHAIASVPEDAGRPAVDASGETRRGAFVAELPLDLGAWPGGTRATCRKERPHPGAQLRLWDHNGWRHQVILTNQEGDPVTLEARHRAHADVENRVKTLTDCGVGGMPFSSFSANQAWTELCLAASDLLAWLKMIGLRGELARAEPKRLRYRLLHVAARIVRRARRVVLRLPALWPWADHLAHAYQRVAALSP